MNALNGLNVNQLSKILADLGVTGRSSLRKKDEKIARISGEDPSKINDYLIKYGKQLISSKNTSQVHTTSEQTSGQTSNQTSGSISKRARKRESQLRTKLKKESERARIEIDRLEAERGEKLTKLNKLKKDPHPGFKKKRARALTREAADIGVKIEQLTKRVKEIESNPKFQKSIEISQRSQENKRIRKKIEELNRKIRRAKGKSKRNLMLKREALKLQLIDTAPKLIDGAFGGNYSKYRIEGIEGMDVPTFFSKIRASIGNVLRRETSHRSIRCQTTSWIRFIKDNERVDKAFNSRMTPVHMLSAHI